MDNFIFNAKFSTIRHNLDEEYDKQNKLSFKMNDVLAIIEIFIDDETVIETLKIARQAKLLKLGNINPR